MADTLSDWARAHARDLAVACALLQIGLLAPAHLSAQNSLGFRFAFGWQEMAGDMGDVLDGGVDAEFSVFYPVKTIRLGIGANWVSLDVRDMQASYNQIGAHVLLGYPVRLGPRLRLYGEARGTYRRLRPEDDRFFGGEEKLLRDFKTSGTGFELVAGMEIAILPSVAVELSGAWGQFGTSPDLSEEGLGPRDSGSTWRVHGGVAWFPLG